MMSDEDNVTPIKTTPPKQPASTVPPQAAPILNPTQATNTVDLDNETVALLVWRGFMGAQPMTIVVSRKSWLANQKIVDDHHAFNPNQIYTFESPVNTEGRQSVFHLQDVVSWAANVHIGA
jgi:hypothetical protein